MDEITEAPGIDYGKIIQRIDGSYVINNGTYHATVDDPQYAQVKDYSDANPDKVIRGQPPTLAEVKKTKLAEISAAKWAAIEHGEVEYQGLRFHTDAASQGLLSSNVQLYQVLQALPQVWKAKDGYLPITSVDQLIAIGGLVAQFVEAQFAREFELAGRVESASTVEEIEGITWPTDD